MSKRDCIRACNCCLSCIALLGYICENPIHWFYILGNIWQEWLLQPGESCQWHLVGWGRQTSDNTHDSSLQVRIIQNKMSILLRLKNPALCQGNYLIRDRPLLIFLTRSYAWLPVLCSFWFSQSYDWRIWMPRVKDTIFFYLQTHFLF